MARRAPARRASRDRIEAIGTRQIRRFAPSGYGARRDPHLRLRTSSKLTSMKPAAAHMPTAKAHQDELHSLQPSRGSESRATPSAAKAIPARDDRDEAPHRLVSPKMRRRATMRRRPAELRAQGSAERIQGTWTMPAALNAAMITTRMRVGPGNWGHDFQSPSPSESGLVAIREQNTEPRNRFASRSHAPVDFVLRVSTEAREAIARHVTWRDAARAREIDEQHLCYRPGKPERPCVTLLLGRFDGALHGLRSLLWNVVCWLRIAILEREAQKNGDRRATEGRSVPRVPQPSHRLRSAARCLATIADAPCAGEETLQSRTRQ